MRKLFWKAVYALSGLEYHSIAGGAEETVKAGNVTKYDAGGSGDNYIPDGYIKSVEKIWMDNYTLTGNVTLTDTTVIIARLPSNKKITSIEVMIETGASQTNGTLSLGHEGDEDAFIPEVIVTHNLTVSVLSFPGGFDVGSVVAESNYIRRMSGFQLVTNGTTGNIVLNLGSAWVMTTGTLKTIVRYT